MLERVACFKDWPGEVRIVIDGAGIVSLFGLQGCSVLVVDHEQARYLGETLIDLADHHAGAVTHRMRRGNSVSECCGRPIHQLGGLSRLDYSGERWTCQGGR